MPRSRAFAGLRDQGKHALPWRHVGLEPLHVLEGIFESERLQVAQRVVVNEILQDPLRGQKMAACSIAAAMDACSSMLE